MNGSSRRWLLLICSLVVDVGCGKLIIEGKVKVNAVTPGFTSTKMNGFAEGGKSPEEGAKVILPWALLAQHDDRTGMSHPRCPICHE